MSHGVTPLRRQKEQRLSCSQRTSEAACKRLHLHKQGWHGVMLVLEGVSRWGGREWVFLGNVCYTFIALSPYLVTISCKLFHGTFCPCNQQAPNRKLARAIILCPWCPYKYACSHNIEILSYISCGLLTSVHCLVSDVRRDGRLYYCDQGETVLGGADPTLAKSASHSFSTINITGGPLYTQLHAWKVRFITAEKQTTNRHTWS